MKKVFMLAVVVGLGMLALALAVGLVRADAVKAEPQTPGVLRGVPAERLDNPPIGITQINSSTVNYVSPTQVVPAIPISLCFNVTVDSPDEEYMDRFDVDLPDTWTATEVYTVPDAGCGYGTIAGVEAGNVVYWQVDAPLPSNCGAWNVGTYDFCANITVPDCSGEPWSFPWNILGDGWGDPPHNVSGASGPVTCRQGNLDLSPDMLDVQGCHTLVQTHTLNLKNDTGTDGVFGLTYDVPSGNGTLTGPDQIYLGDGVDQDLLVELTPDACLPAGAQVVGIIAASGVGFSDVSTITKTIVHGETCPSCPVTNLPIVLKNHQ